METWLIVTIWCLGSLWTGRRKGGLFVVKMILLMLDCCGGIMNGVGVKGGNDERIVMAHLR